MRSWTLRVLAVLTLMFAFSGPMVAQEAPVAPAAPAITAPADPAPVAEAGEDAGFIASNIEGIVAVIGGILTLLAGLGVFGKYKEKIEKITESKTWEIAKSAVVETYHEYVRGIKKGRDEPPGSPSGKLTKEEAKEARRMAIEKIKALGKSAGVKIVKHQLPNLVELAVNFMKKKAKEAK